MANMGYCRFENTYHDLQDCFDSLREKDFNELSESEKNFRNKLVEMCKDIADEFEIEETEE